MEPTAGGVAAASAAGAPDANDDAEMTLFVRAGELVARVRVRAGGGAQADAFCSGGAAWSGRESAQAAASAASGLGLSASERSQRMCSALAAHERSRMHGGILDDDEQPWVKLSGVSSGTPLKLEWRIPSGQAVWQTLELQAVTESKAMVRDVTDALLRDRDALDELAGSREKHVQKLVEERDALISKLEGVATMREQEQEDLFERVAKLLNSKKRRIAELLEEVSKLRRRLESAGAGANDGIGADGSEHQTISSTDEEEREERRERPAAKRRRAASDVGADGERAGRVGTQRAAAATAAATPPDAGTPVAPSAGAAPGAGANVDAQTPNELELSPHDSLQVPNSETPDELCLQLALDSQPGSQDRISPCKPRNMPLLGRPK